MIRRLWERLRHPRRHIAGTGRLMVTINADTTAFVEAMRKASASAARMVEAFGRHANCRSVRTPIAAASRRELLHQIRMAQDRLYIEEIGAHERAIAVEWFEARANELWESLGMERPTNIVRGES